MNGEFQVANKSTRGVTRGCDYSKFEIHNSEFAKC